MKKETLQPTPIKCKELEEIIRKNYMLINQKSLTRNQQIYKTFQEKVYGQPKQAMRLKP